MEQILHHLHQDKILSSLINQIDLPEIVLKEDLYFVLCEAVVSQQLSVKAADTIFGRFCQLFENQYPTPEILLEIPTEKLREVGLSAQKSAYLKNIAQFHLENLALTADNLAVLSDDEIIKKLTIIKGVGKWTVEMLLIFALNRLDIFPIDDLGIRQAMIMFYQIEETGKEQLKKMQCIAETWQPYRSVASRYLWRAKDLKKASKS